MDLEELFPLIASSSGRKFSSSASSSFDPSAALSFFRTFFVLISAFDQTQRYPVIFATEKMWLLTGKFDQVGGFFFFCIGTEIPFLFKSFECHIEGNKRLDIFLKVVK